MSDTDTLLLKHFHRLPESQQQALLDYAEYLNQRYGEEIKDIPELPLDIPRPAEESVVKAIKRLSKTYPMLDSKELFEKTSSFMMRNMMHGEKGNVVIDEMQLFFEERFQFFRKNKSESTDTED